MLRTGSFGYAQGRLCTDTSLTNTNYIKAASLPSRRIFTRIVFFDEIVQKRTTFFVLLRSYTLYLLCNTCSSRGGLLRGGCVS